MNWRWQAMLWMPDKQAGWVFVDGKQGRPVQTSLSRRGPRGSCRSGIGAAGVERQPRRHGAGGASLSRLHTIKGSGAMFGFEDLATFTHNLETAFDEVRNGRLPISSELIDLTLSALDQIRAMLEEGHGRGACQADPAACAEILAKVRHLTGKPEKHPPRRRPRLPRERCWLRCWIRSRFPNRRGPGAGVVDPLCSRPDFMLNGANPLLLLRELKQLGGLAVRASMAAVPPLKRTGPGALLHQLGDGAGHGGGARCDSRCLHLCRGQLRADDHCEPIRRGVPSGRAEAPSKPRASAAGSAADLTARRWMTSAPPPAAAAPMMRPTTPRACACPPPSWTSLSIWWANW
jgi:HPt (histidine-containing phosphotransfer) domain-containing protein